MRSPAKSRVGALAIARKSPARGKSSSRKGQHLEERAGDSALVDGAGAVAVDLDLGLLEVLVQKAGVRRSGGVEDGDALGGRCLERCDHVADDTANLVVGIRGVDDLGGRWDLGALVGVDPEPVEGLLDGGVSPTYRGQASDDGHLRVGSECGGEADFGLGEVLREIEDEGAKLCGRRGLVRDESGSAVEELGRVVVLGPDACGRGPVETDEIASRVGDVPDRVKSGGGQVTELEVCLGDGANSGRVVGDRGEDARVVGERGAPSGCDDRSGRRPARS